MEQVNLGYSMKNIPVPSQESYLQVFINSIETFSRNIAWRAFWYLNPNEDPEAKEKYGFKSLAPAPYVKDLKVFEDGLLELIKDIRFEDKHSSFQSKLKEDAKSIRNESKIFVAGDKSTNFHMMEPQNYNDLLEKAIHKD